MLKNVFLSFVGLLSACLVLQPTIAKPQTQTETSFPLSVSRDKNLSTPDLLLAQAGEIDNQIASYLGTANSAANKQYWKNAENPSALAYNDFFIYFAEWSGAPVMTYPGDVRSVMLYDGTNVTVRPFSTSTNSPTIDILRSGSSSPTKVRYLPPNNTLSYTYP